MSLRLLAVVSCIFCMLANADTIKFKAPACQTDDLLSEFTRYIIKNDLEGMTQLLHYGDCVIVVAGDNVSLIKWGISKSEIRIDGIKYYVASEAVEQNTNSNSFPTQKTEKQRSAQTPQPKVEIKSKKPNLEAEIFIVQVISTESKESAEQTTKLLYELGYQPRNRMLTVNEKTIYRIFTQGFKEKEDAIRAKKQIDQSFKVNSLVLPLKN